MNVHADAFISAFVGCGVAVALAKFAITKALADLDELMKKVNRLAEVLAATAVRLEKIAEHDLILKDHAKKIAFFEGVQSDASPRSIRAYPNGILP